VSKRPGFVDDGRQLRAGRHQHLHVVIAEFPRLDRLDDEHPDQQAVVEQRHPEKRSIGVLAGLAEILEPGVQRGVGDGLGLLLLGDEP
jgi:hypothetical protein